MKRAIRFIIPCLVLFFLAVGLYSSRSWLLVPGNVYFWRDLTVYDTTATRSIEAGQYIEWLLGASEATNTAWTVYVDGLVGGSQWVNLYTKTDDTLLYMRGSLRNLDTNYLQGCSLIRFRIKTVTPAVDTDLTNTDKYYYLRLVKRP